LPALPGRQAGRGASRADSWRFESIRAELSHEIPRVAPGVPPPASHAKGAEFPGRQRKIAQLLRCRIGIFLRRSHLSHENVN
jgi:hypothetical protein